MSYSNIIKNKAVIKNDYRCNNCKCVKKGKPWSIYDYNGIKKLCSYICHTKERTIHPVWDNLVNVEDFENIIIPNFEPVVETFYFKTNLELDELTDEEYTKYMNMREEHYSINPERAKLEEKYVEDENYIDKLENISL